MAKGILDIGAVYMFLKRLVTPFEEWDAFKTGVIDADGKVITPKKDRTGEQDRSWGYFDRLVGNLKKLLGKVPGGKTRLGTFAAALLLIKEQELDPDDLEYLEECLHHYMKEVETLNEEIPTNAAGGGNIAGIGVGPDGEPGVPERSRKKLKKRNKKEQELLNRLIGELK